MAVEMACVFDRREKYLLRQLPGGSIFIYNTHIFCILFLPPFALFAAFVVTVPFSSVLCWLAGSIVEKCRYE